MIILVDQDGPLADFEQGFLNKWWEKYPGEFSVSLTDRTDFEVYKDYPENLHEKVKEIYTASGFIESLEPVVGGLESIKLMLELGHEVFICTAPLSNPTCAAEKWAWIEKYLGKEWLRRLIITKDKTIVRGDILIDDRPEVSGVFKPTWEHVLYDEPYNLKTPGQKRRLSWNNWRTVLGI